MATPCFGDTLNPPLFVLLRSMTQKVRGRLFYGFISCYLFIRFSRRHLASRLLSFGLQTKRQSGALGTQRERERDAAHRQQGDDDD